MDSANAPLVVPAVPSHFSSLTKPKEGLKILIPAESNAKNGKASTAFPPAIQHLSKLDSVASERWELSEPTSVEPGFTVEILQETPPDNSDFELRTGKFKDPSPWSEPLMFTYKGRSVLEDHQ